MTGPISSALAGELADRAARGDELALRAAAAWRRMHAAPHGSRQRRHHRRTLQRLARQALR